MKTSRGLNYEEWSHYIVYSASLWRLKSIHERKILIISRVEIYSFQFQGFIKGSIFNCRYLRVIKDVLLCTSPPDWLQAHFHYILIWRNPHEVETIFEMTFGSHCWQFQFNIDQIRKYYPDFCIIKSFPFCWNFALWIGWTVIFRRFNVKEGNDFR